MSLVRWDPFREMVSLRDAMDRLFSESFVGMPTVAREGQALALDVYETDDDLIVEGSLPGFKPEDVEISIVGSTLNIKAETESEKEGEEKGKYHYRERRYGSFQRSVALPTDVDGNKAEAVFEDGVLKLTLPKVEEAKPKRIEVRTKGK